MAGKFKRTTPHKCQRCGMCCQGRGDFAFGDWTDDGEYEPENCTALQYDGFTAGCRMQGDKRACCEDYPWDEWCERELKEKGLWKEYAGA